MKLYNYIGLVIVYSMSIDTIIHHGRHYCECVHVCLFRSYNNIGGRGISNGCMYFNVNVIIIHLKVTVSRPGPTLLTSLACSSSPSGNTIAHVGTAAGATICARWTAYCWKINIRKIAYYTSCVLEYRHEK